MQKPAKLFWAYFKLAYVRWWTAAYLSIVGIYDLVDRATPKEVLDMPDLTAQALWWLALPLLFLAPFPVFLHLQRQIAGVEGELRRQASFNRREATRAALDLKFGPRSNITPSRRFDLATEYFVQLEAEILTGDFTHADEVIAIQDLMVPVFRDWFAGGAGYYEWHERLVAVVEAVQRRQLELAKDLEGGP